MTRYRTPTRFTLPTAPAAHDGRAIRPRQILRWSWLMLPLIALPTEHVAGLRECPPRREAAPPGITRAFGVALCAAASR